MLGELLLSWLYISQLLDIIYSSMSVDLSVKKHSDRFGDSIFGYNDGSLNIVIDTIMLITTSSSNIISNKSRVIANSIQYLLNKRLQKWMVSELIFLHVELTWVVSHQLIIKSFGIEL